MRRHGILGIEHFDYPAALYFKAPFEEVRRGFSFHQVFIPPCVNYLQIDEQLVRFVPKSFVMKSSLLLTLFAVAISLNSCSQINAKKQEVNNIQAPPIGGNCEGCEAIHESPIPFEKLSAVATLPDFNETGPKIEISGIIYKADGRTPAKDVVLYVYHTDQKGKYSTNGNETGWGKRHGYIRAWIKTDQNGFYKFYTLVPASYPNSKSPKHIHPTIKETDKNEYWIDEFLFDDDPYLPKEEKNKLNPRGGSGVLKTYVKEGMLRATRNIILGLNVPAYPVAKKAHVQPGLLAGEDWITLISLMLFTKNTSSPNAK